MRLQRVSTISIQNVEVKNPEEVTKLLVEWDREFKDVINLEYKVEGADIISTDAANYQGKWYIVITKILNKQGIIKQDYMLVFTKILLVTSR